MLPSRRSQVPPGVLEQQLGETGEGETGDARTREAWVTWRLWSFTRTVNFKDPSRARNMQVRTFTRLIPGAGLPPQRPTERRYAFGYCGILDPTPGPRLCGISLRRRSGLPSGWNRKRHP